MGSLGGRTSAFWSFLGLLTLAGPAAQATPVASVGPPASAQQAKPAVSADTYAMLQWVLAAGDHHGMPFAIVDKKAARLFLFDAAGQLLGASPALLGLMPGDAGSPQTGRRDVTQIPPTERTTPAGRFASEPGRNLQGEEVVWVDYDAGLAIHRLRPAPSSQRRPQRMLALEPAERRISLGCVVVPVSFYQSVVAPVLGRQRGVVYVLPETQTLQSLFGRPQRRLG